MKRIALLLFPLLLLTLAVPAHADDKPGGGDLKARIQKKMQRIVELMKKNEAALLKLSTGKSAVTKKVDVEVPQPPKGASGSQGAAGPAGTKGKEIGKQLDELISGQRKSGGTIPDELKQLVEMIPLWSSCSSQFGSQQPHDKQQKSAEQKRREQQARDARKKLGQRNESKPEDGETSPQDPARKVPRKGGKPDEVKSDGGKRKDQVPAWMAALPPEIRDAIAGGRAEDIPAKHRHLVKAYHLWLQKHKKP